MPASVPRTRTLVGGAWREGGWTVGGVSGGGTRGWWWVRGRVRVGALGRLRRASRFTRGRLLERPADPHLFRDAGHRQRFPRASWGMQVLEDPWRGLCEVAGMGNGACAFR